MRRRTLTKLYIISDGVCLLIVAVGSLGHFPFLLNGWLGTILILVVSPFYMWYYLMRARS